MTPRPLAYLLAAAHHVVRVVGEKWAEADTRAASAVAEPWWTEKSDD